MGLLSMSDKFIVPSIKEFRVSEVWGFFNHTKMVYISFFLMLVDNILFFSISDCNYDAVVLSDHAPMSVKIHFKKFVSTQLPWRLNSWLLADEDFFSFFFIYITSLVVSASLL